MDHIKKLKYTYTDKTQYAQVDHKSHGIVKAEYARVKGYEGNADIEALPRPLSGKELDDQDVQKAINRTLYSGLVRSYKGRRHAVTKPGVHPAFDEKTQLNILSASYTNNIVDGAAIIGSSAMDRDTAVNNALCRYPKAISHTTPDGSYVQIPVLRTSAFANGNVSSTFQMFAAQLDDILGAGTTHQDLLPRVNIGKMCSCIIGWIQTYHIGCWIIEEIPFYVFFTSPKYSGTIVSIMQETGVFLLVTGKNTYFYSKIDGSMRLKHRLFGNIVNMDDTGRNEPFVKVYF